MRWRMALYLPCRINSRWGDMPHQGAQIVHLTGITIRVNSDTTLPTAEDQIDIQEHPVAVA